MTTLPALFLSLLLQISTPGPQINRQEDLRRQTETSVSRRVEDDRKFVLARSTQTFRENTARLLTEVDEICALRIDASRETRKTIADRAKRMDTLIGQILWYLDKSKASKVKAPGAGDALQVFCTVAKEGASGLGTLVENSKKDLRDPALEADARGRLESQRELLKPLHKRK